LHIFIVEVQRNLFKVTANRRQYKTSLHIFIVEVQRNLFKVTANRRHFKTSLHIFIVEVQRNLFKVTANRRHFKTSKLVFVLLRGDVIALVTFKGAEINDFSLFDEKSKPKIWRYKLKNVTLHPLIKQSETVIHCDCKTTSIDFLYWRDGRVVECTGLENRRTERYRGFESLSLRNVVTLSSDLLFSLRAPHLKHPMERWQSGRMHRS
jgi:hypothetical protein